MSKPVWTENFVFLGVQVYIYNIYIYLCIHIYVYIYTSHAVTPITFQIGVHWYQFLEVDTFGPHPGTLCSNKRKSIVLLIVYQLYIHVFPRNADSNPLIYICIYASKYTYVYIYIHIHTLMYTPQCNCSSFCSF